MYNSHCYDPVVTDAQFLRHLIIDYAFQVDL